MNTATVPLLIASRKHQQLFTVACPSCLWSSAGAVQADLAQSWADEHQQQCEGVVPPRQTTEHRVELTRRMLAAEGVVVQQ